MSALKTEISLPSSGKPYNGASPICHISPMTAREEKLLAGNLRARYPGEIVSRILESCVEYSVPMNDLVLGDRTYLMFMIRANSYGDEYGFQLRCPSCDHQFRKVLKLSEYPIRTLGEKWEEPFEDKLPISGKIVKLRLLRGTDEKAILVQMNQHRQFMTKMGAQEDDMGDPTFIYRITRHVVELDGKRGMADVTPLIETLPALDIRFIVDSVAQNDCGFEADQMENCPECGFMFDYYLPFGPEFFRPRLPQPRRHS